MDYKKQETSHLIVLDKDELITLIALVHEARESLQLKAQSGDPLAVVKLEGAVSFVDELNKRIMRS